MIMQNLSEKKPTKSKKKIETLYSEYYSTQ